MVDTGTNLYTLQTEFGLAQRATGAGSVVLTTGAWARDMEKLKSSQANEKMAALMRKLAGMVLDAPITQGWIKYPLHYTGGVAELRSKGVRSYGKSIGKDQTRTVVVFEAAESKRQEDEADKVLTQRAADETDIIARRWRKLAATAPSASATSGGAPADVVSLDQRRSQQLKRKR